MSSCVRGWLQGTGCGPGKPRVLVGATLGPECVAVSGCIATLCVVDKVLAYWDMWSQGAGQAWCVNPQLGYRPGDRKVPVGVGRFYCYRIVGSHEHRRVLQGKDVTDVRPSTHATSVNLDSSVGLPVLPALSYHACWWPCCAESRRVQVHEGPEAGLARPLAALVVLCVPQPIRGPRYHVARRSACRTFLTGIEEGEAPLHDALALMSLCSGQSLGRGALRLQCAMCHIAYYVNLRISRHGRGTWR